MAQAETMSMVEGNCSGTSGGNRVLVEESSPTNASSSFFSALEERSCSSAEAAASASSLPTDSAPGSSKYFSARIQSMMESGSKFESKLEAEIEASKVHWSEVQEGLDGKGSAEANFEVFRRLQSQYGGPDGFFSDWDADSVALGEKIAEGAQGEIFHLKWLRPEDFKDNGKAVVKVFKLEGWSLEDLQKQWPQGMLLKTVDSEDGYYVCAGCGVLSGMMLEDGRFGFVMLRCWGDLRKVIDMRMQHNGNQAPPFVEKRALQIMHGIARGMRGLHGDNIVHRDLKASNVLIFPNTWDLYDPHGEFNPLSNGQFALMLADFECSGGVVGTGFWRAPEILLGVKNRKFDPSVFTEKADVYSYAMTCFEILTGRIPLEGIRANDYDEILVKYARPMLPSDIQPWIRFLLERCWDHEALKRPSFEEVVLEFERWNIKCYILGR